MTIRRAIKRKTEILAECPGNGVCKWTQKQASRVAAFSCSYFHGTFEDARGLMVRCSFDK